METVKVTVELPALPEGWEYTGEFRLPERGEYYSYNAKPTLVELDFMHGLSLIIRKAKWKPVYGEYYYFVKANGKVAGWTCRTYDMRVVVGNCFKTREEAEVVASKFKNILAGE